MFQDPPAIHHFSFPIPGGDPLRIRPRLAGCALPLGTPLLLAQDSQFRVVTEARPAVA